MAYTTIAEIRAKTQYTVSDITDAALTEMIAQSTAEINNEINVRVIREKVTYIDNTKQNKLDGSNKTFWTRNAIVNYFSDNNNDGEVTITDIKVELEEDDEITEVTVSSIDVEGSFVLASAPDTATVRMYITYSYSYYDVTTPDKLINLLSTYLASSYSILVVDSGLPYQTKLGNIAITVPIANTMYKQFNDRYRDLLRKVKIPLNKPRIKTYKYLI